MEENLRRSLLISDGSFSFLWDRPLTLIMLRLLFFGKCRINQKIQGKFIKKPLV